MVMRASWSASAGKRPFWWGAAQVREIYKEVKQKYIDQSSLEHLSPLICRGGRGIKM